MRYKNINLEFLVKRFLQMAKGWHTQSTHILSFQDSLSLKYARKALLDKRDDKHPP